MTTITIPIGCEGGASEQQFRTFCEHFSCTLEKRKLGAVEWVIHAEDANDIFWLGANMNFRHKDGVSISVASKLLNNEQGRCYS